MNLRWRIGTLVVSTTAAAVACVGVWVHVDAYNRELKQARSAVRTDLDRAASVYARTGEVRGTGARLDAELPEGLAGLVRRGHHGTELVDGPRGRQMWAARPAGDRTLSVTANVEPTLRDLEALDASIAVAGALTAGVLLPAGAFTASRLSRRLRLAAATATRISHGELDARIGVPERPRDEIDEISHAVDTMAAALQSRLLTEQRFTADVAHELRTPLMGLLTAAENLPEGRITDHVRERVRALCSLTDDLLEISRLDTGAEEPDLAAWSLGLLVQQAVARADFPVRVDPVEDGHTATLVRTDPRRLNRILANLLANAHRHGRPPVEVAVTATSVTVRDHGRGYPEELLTDGPQRFRTHAPERGKGHGLGLTIALGQAEVIGARLRFGNAPDGGAEAVLTLPAAPDEPL
ncbi:HAMP domain-containing sensor histidine kinase [Streptomyces sp. NPDC029044]|uniref:HAMP domain-containing sensor histidine kinase n=1 Tax=Streptomyces sp. NPDC029044 TaxID=3157198 RepID=UPI0033E7816B